MHKQNVLTIAGSDCSGGAGIQADIKTFEALNVYSASVITSITAQNTQGVQSVYDLPANFITKQLDSIFSDIHLSAVKIGMLKRTDYIDAIQSVLSKQTNLHVVLDPVMVSTSGHSLIDEDAKIALTKKLFPLTDIITPNIPEAAVLLAKDPNWIENHLKQACHDLFDKYELKAVLLKGGHMRGDTCQDTLAIKDIKTHKINNHIFRYKKIHTQNTHGTGCSLSSAIAAYLAKEESLETSVALAGQFLNKAIANSNLLKVGKGHGPINHKSGSCL